MNTIAYITKINLTSTALIQTGFLWDLVLFFSCVGGIYFILVFLLKHKLTRKERNTIVLKKDIAPLVSTLLFHKKKATRKQNEEFVNAKVHLQELLKNPEHRKRVSEILMDIQTDLSGDTRQRLIKIYQDFGLHHDAIRRLKSWRWEIVCRGINELTQMQVTDAYTYIRRFVNDKRSIVRKQAQLATVALKPEGINYFLDTAKYKISEWQQLKLMETLHDLPEFTPPQFRLWLTSNNKDVVLFAVRLIKSFKQDDALDSLMKLVKHRDDKIKVEAIDCMRAFDFRKAVPLFKAIFWNCRSDVKLALLTAMGEMGTKEEIPFLKEVEKRASDYMIKSKAIGTINALAPESILPSDEINESLDDPKSMPVIGETEEGKVTPAVNQDPHHQEFQDSLQSPEFQKYDEASLEDEFVYDMMVSKDLQDLPVVADELHSEDEYFIVGVDDTVEIDEADSNYNQVLTKTAEQIKVEYKLLDTRPDYQNVDDFVVTNDFVQEKEFEEELLHFAAISEITDHANYEYEDDEEEEELPVEELHAIYVVYDEVSDAPDTSDLLEPFFEIEWPVDSNEKVGYDLGTGPLNFELELYPEAFEKKIRSRDMIWDKNIHSKEKEVSYSSAFEQLFYASDLDGKLLLLDDILRLGDERDIIFLRKLRDDKSAAIRQCADRIIKLLTKRLYPAEDPETFEIPVYEANPDLMPEFEIDQEEDKVHGKKEEGEKGGKPRRKPEERSLFNDTMRRIQKSMKKSDG